MKDFSLILIVVALACWGTKTKIADEAPPELPLCNIEAIPGPGGNWRSPQLDARSLDSVLSTGQVRLLVRLNGDGKDAGPLPVAEEEAIAAANGVAFSRLDVEREGALDWLHRELLEGRVYVHCRHGFDRTGAAVGYHLRWTGFTQEEIIRHNRWKDYLATKSRAYWKYWRMALKD